MTFIQDLRRWLRAQLQARARERQRRTAEEIRRLIDYPPVREPIAPNDRPPIPGTVGIGKRTNPSSVELPPILLEHGMLIFPETGPTMFPLTQYNTSELQSYLTGLGTQIPNLTDIYQYLIGNADISEQFCLGGYQRYNWAASAAIYTPEYLSMVYFDADRYARLDEMRRYANRWSGLTLFLCQVLVGSDRTFEELLEPVGWTADPTTDGLIRFWDADASSFRWWYVQNTVLFGVQAVELVPTLEGRCPLAWLNAHALGTLTLSETDLRMFEAWAMRSFQAQTTTINVLAAGELAPVWANGASAVKDGWATSVQELGNATSETIVAQCITTLWEELIQPDGVAAIHHGTTFEVQYNLTSGNLGAALVMHTPSQAHIEPSVAPLWYPNPSGSGLALFFTQINDPGTTADYCDVYSWYDKEELVKAEYVRHFTSIGQSRQYLWEDTYHCVDVQKGWIAMCSDEIGTVWRFGETVAKKAGGGWRVREVDAGGTWGEGGADPWRETKTFQVVTLHQERTCCEGDQDPTTAECLGQNAAWCGGTAQAEVDALCANKFNCQVVNHRLKSGDSEIWWYKDAYDAASWGGKGLILPRDHREGVYLTQGFHYENHRRKSEVVRKFFPPGQIPGPDCPGPDCGQFNLGHCQFQFYYRLIDNQGEPSYYQWGDWHNYGMGSCEGADAFCAPSGPWEVQPVVDLEDDNMQAWFIGRHQTIGLVADWDAWLPYITAQQNDTRAWDPTAVMSHFEGAGSYFELPNSKLVTGSLPGDPNSDFYLPSGSV